MKSDYQICEYQAGFAEDILTAIGEYPDWQIFTGNEARKENYRKALSRGLTLVCYCGHEFCGYVRAIPDQGIAVYVSELFVKPEHRNRRIAQRLIETIKDQCRSLAVYVLSDEDLYYRNKGYRRVGSVFEVEAGPGTGV